MKNNYSSRLKFKKINMKKYNLLKLSLLSISISIGLFFGQSASALDFIPPSFSNLSYSGSYYDQTVADPILMTAGETKTITVRIKNKGTSSWYVNSNNYISVYTANPSYRNSDFSNSTWIDSNQGQLVKLLKDTIPGQIASFKITLTAPEKTGDYREDFYLAAENKTWIKGGYFYLKIKVSSRTTQQTDTVATKSTNQTEETTKITTAENNQINNDDYQANLTAFSSRKVTASGGELIKFKVRYYNDGSKAWNNYIWQENGSDFIQSELSSNAGSRITTADTSWINNKKIFSGEKIINPKEVLEINYNFRMPTKKGSYIARFQLITNGNSSEGGLLELPLFVTSNAPTNYTVPTFATNQARILKDEPNIRVGLYKTSKPTRFKSSFNYQVWAGLILKGTLPVNNIASLSYYDGLYTFSSPSLEFTGRELIRLVPIDQNSYFTLPDYDRHVKWKGPNNFNIYRGIMEYKFSNKSNMPWIVNELGMENYIAGIAETSNGAAIEYIKALLVAARSYAYYHINNGIPADQRTFDVYATTADQLYLGYGSEVIMPRVVQAARATSGEMVTYLGEPVVTPYYGHSDGKTRTWKEVWGGTNKPWLVPVDCKYDVGQNMFGHGVGMSARDAAWRADTDGWLYDQLLKHYYTNTDVELIF